MNSKEVLGVTFPTRGRVILARWRHQKRWVAAIVGHYLLFSGLIWISKRSVFSSNGQKIITWRELPRLPNLFWDSESNLIWPGYCRAGRLMYSVTRTLIYRHAFFWLFPKHIVCLPNQAFPHRCCDCRGREFWSVCFWKSSWSQFSVIFLVYRIAKVIWYDFYST